MSTFSKYSLYSPNVVGVHSVYTNIVCVCGYVHATSMLTIEKQLFHRGSDFAVLSTPSGPRKSTSKPQTSTKKDTAKRTTKKSTAKKSTKLPVQGNDTDKNGKSSKKDIKRLRIIEAAITVIAKKGYHAARMSDIAKSAGVADGTIYNYFQNKEHVLLCIFEEKMAELIDQLTIALAQQSSPLEKIRLFIRNHFEHLQQHPELGQVFQVELRQSQLFFHGYKPKRLFEYLALLGNSIKEGQQQGVLLSTMDSYLLQWSIFGTLDELSMNWVVSGRQWPMDLDSLPDQIFDIFLKGIIRQ